MMEEFRMGAHDRYLARHRTGAVVAPRTSWVMRELARQAVQELWERRLSATATCNPWMDLGGD